MKERGSYKHEAFKSQSMRDRYAAEIASVLADYDVSEVAVLLAAGTCADQAREGDRHGAAKAAARDEAAGEAGARVQCEDGQKDL